MNFLNVVLFTLVLKFQFIVIIQGFETELCLKQINSCACETANGVIDLQPLDQAKIDGKPKFSNINEPKYIDFFSYNPCTAYTIDSSCSNVAGCRNHLGNNNPIGTQESAMFGLSSPTTLEYSSTSGGIARKMTIKLTCDENKEGTLTTSGEDPSSEGHFKFELQSKYACSLPRTTIPGKVPTNHTLAPTTEATTQKPVKDYETLIIVMAFALAIAIVFACAYCCWCLQRKRRKIWISI